MKTTLQTSKQKISIIGRYTVIALLLLVTFSSCTMEKRLYRPGLHVAFKKSRVKIENSTAPETNNVSSQPTVVEQQETPTLTLTATTEENNTLSKVLVNTKTVTTKTNTICTPVVKKVEDKKSDESDTKKQIRHTNKRKIAVSILLSALSLVFNFVGFWVLSLILAGVMIALMISTASTKAKAKKLEVVDANPKKEKKNPFPAGALVLLIIFIVLVILLVSLLSGFVGIVTF